MEASMAVQPLLHRYRFGPYEVDIDRRELRKFSHRVPLQPQPFEALVCLLRRSRQIVAREELCARLWPNDVHVDFEHSLNRIINKLRLALCDSADSPKYIETIPGRGYRFLIAPTECHPTASADLAEVKTALTRGALPLHSPYYVERAIDGNVRQAIANRDSIVLLKGARQTGKTSLLSRVIDHARCSGAQGIVTDFQKFSTIQLGSVDALLPALAEDIADQMHMKFSFESEWLPRRGATVNLDRFMKRHVLSEPQCHVVWGMDEADRLFAYPFASEVFGLLRSWHNERALRTGSPCERLTLVIAYATEAHLFISDLNQSPFNVGSRFYVGDLTQGEVRELNRRYKGPLKENEIARFYDMLGGHPYLTQDGLHEIVSRDLSFADFDRVARTDDGPFGEHLRRIVLALRKADDLSAAVAGLLQGQNGLSADAFYRLRTAGIICGDSPRNAEMRCDLYHDYLSRYLL